MKTGSVTEGRYRCTNSCISRKIEHMHRSSHRREEALPPKSYSRKGLGGRAVDWEECGADSTVDGRGNRGLSGGCRSGRDVCDGKEEGGTRG